MVFPNDLEPDEYGLVGIGADLSIATLLEAYSKGIFPWSGEDPIPWYSPDPRLILVPEDFQASRSLLKAERQGRYTVRYDHDFRAVMRACMSIPRRGQSGSWINERLISSYAQLFDLHIGHSVEVLDQAGRLVGGLYGISLGRAFFGESMFSTQPNTSKLALYSLCRNLTTHGFHFIDCQQDTPHLRSLGSVLVSRTEYLRRLKRALQYPTLRRPWSDFE